MITIIPSNEILELIFRLAELGREDERTWNNEFNQWSGEDMDNALIEFRNWKDEQIALQGSD